MAEREDSGRQARVSVFLDETEHPQTLHEVAQIILSCHDRPLDDDEIVTTSDRATLREDLLIGLRTIDPNSIGAYDITEAADDVRELRDAVQALIEELLP